MSEPMFWPWSAVYSIVVFSIVGISWLVERRRPGSTQRVGLVVALGSSLIYITWRVLFTIPSGNWISLVAGVLLVAAELAAIVQMVASTVRGWRQVEHVPVPLSALASIPSVDIYIATFSESIGVLEPTLAGAMSIRYPGDFTVYLCDDGSRPAVRKLAKRYGAEYLERDEHQHAKAGNLNNALANSGGELVVTLDADMIPTVDFLEKTVGYFVDENLAFVQAPQAFHNQDVFQHNLFSGKGLPNEQDLFMRTLQAGNGRFNAVMYVGSNAVIRRTALDAIGGFAIGVITEDMATGMLLQAAGYRTLFVPDIIAAGLAAENLSDLLTQRIRWARGNIQTARKWNPLTLPGLSWMQRWIYAAGIVYWNFGILKIVFILAPLVYLIGGIPILHAGVSSILVIWLPYFVASFVGMKVASQGRRSFTWSHVYEIAMAPTIAVAIVTEWLGFSKKVFAVTPKGVSTDKLNFRVAIASPHIVLLGLSLYALLNAFVLSPGEFNFGSVVIISFWTVYNLVGLVMAILVCLERPRKRSTERTEVDLPVEVRLWKGAPVEGRVLDLSFNGVRFALPWSNAFGPTEAARQLEQKGEIAIDGIGLISGSSRWVSETNNGLLVGFEFDELPPAEAVKLVAKITSSPRWVRHDREVSAGIAGAAARTVIGAARKANPALRTELRVATHGIAHLRQEEFELAPSFEVDLEDLSFGGCRILSPRRLSLGDHYQVDLGDRRSGGAEVQWVERHGGRYLAGLKFDGVMERMVQL
ncbi:glycosyltransferase family 2 protein [Ferrimicrobium acidiphilum]|jgi:cellulose synthase (UDP-forming)|uniref:glycosyltransferase family 2 protein n=2 Tax=Ferrimicrobium acidiphilum TaxID=121039 RepID=UPI0023F503FD|nr:glycosyltransferase family 2 protein [Ferrimicrobium acidiphilum]